MSYVLLDLLNRFWGNILFATAKISWTQRLLGILSICFALLGRR